jgi:hypothetical protein
MTGDHHGQTARRATLLVTAADEILGTHRVIDETRDTAGWRHLIARTPQPLNDAVRFADGRMLRRISGSILGS